MPITDDQKVEHDALLKEMHKADDLVEKHSELIITITGAAFAFAATQLNNPHVVYMALIFGLLVSIEWFAKISRHKQIFLAAREKLAVLETTIGINTARPISRINGFSVLQAFAVLMAAGWIGLGVSVWNGWLTKKGNLSASSAFEKVSEEMPKLANNPSSKWELQSMNWREQDRTYEILMFTQGKPQETWNIIFDIENARITKWKKQ